jgi:hypothetical protein
LGKAEMLETERLRGRMLRRTPVFGGIERIHGSFSFVSSVALRAALPRILWAEVFGESVRIFRCIRESGCDRRPNVRGTQWSG